MQQDYCFGKDDGNYEWTDYPSFYLACSGSVVSVMPCATAGLVYDITCDACVWPWQKGTHNNGTGSGNPGNGKK